MIGIIILLILLNALYYGYLVVKWNDYTADGCTGQSILGILLTIAILICLLSVKKSNSMNCENHGCKNKLEHPKGKNFISIKTNKEICNDCARWEQGYS